MWGDLALLAGLLLLSGFSSMSEVALVGVSYAKLRALAKKDREFKKIEELKRIEGAPLLFIVLLNNVVNTLIASLATKIALSFGEQYFGVGVALTTMAILLFGEIIPKLSATKMDMETKGKLLKLFYKLYGPFAPIFESIARAMNLEKKYIIDETELQELFNIGKETGELSDTEKDLLTSAMRFDDKPVEKIMRPLENVFMVEKNTTIGQLLKDMKAYGALYTRVPVYSESKDKIIGIFNIKSILAHNLRKSSKVGRYVNPPLKVFRYEELDDVLEKMKRHNERMVIVVDGDERALGIVTLEDIMEELIGELGREFGKRSRTVWKDKEGYYILSTADMATVEKSLGIETDYTNLKDFVEKNLQKIPEKGDSFSHKGWRFEIKRKWKNKYILHATPQKEEGEGE
ncbi:MAG: HlyC/CorC family transporter [Candidatus Micrarchaeota archaeon]|nr:HlyC/CorC family transporter [Candidatus Micrarchaeota archaeon]